MSVEARQHHIQMKYLLAQMAIQNPERFFAMFATAGDLAYLHNLWVAVGQRLPADERVPSDALAAWHQRAGEIPEVLVLTLPPPVATNEAHFLGAVRLPEGDCRVFLLEEAAMPAAGEASTVLAELAAHGRSHWGPGCEPVVEQFAALLCRLVSDPSAQPRTFIPMRLG